MQYYKIEKFFKGGGHVYFAKLRESRTIKKTCVNYQLEAWGDSTDGGHNYGYRMDMRKINKLPKGAKITLQFYEDYLTKKMRVKNGRKKISNN
jgi:hypothetical protein